MKFTVGTLILCFSLLYNASGQGLFEQGIPETRQNTWSLSGYIRGVAWMGKSADNNVPEAKALYSGGELNLSVRPSGFAEGKLSFRLRDGKQDGYEPYGTELREAWVRLHHGHFSLIAGRQIIAWGRADSNNPTDLITPWNPLFHSPDPDDIRLGNFLFNGTINPGSHFYIQGIWIPVYRPSVIPVTAELLPAGLPVPVLNTPSETLRNSGYAFKTDFTFPVIDFSVSWFDGFETYPLFTFGGYVPADSLLIPVIGVEPFREQVLGADFSTTIGSVGLRGEFAYRHTKGYEQDIHVALPDIRLVAGVDRSFGNLSAEAQYSGYFIPEYSEVAVPDGGANIPPDQLLLFYNRLMFRQTKSSQHEISLHVSWSPGQEKIRIEGYGSCNLTTGESVTRLQMKWNLSDGVAVTGGWQHFAGGKNTLFELVSPLLDGFYMQGKLFF